MKRCYNALVAEAKQQIKEIPAADAMKLHGDADVVIVDLRDPRELELEGRIPGSFHCPRGMLEFWVDPESPYFKPVFGEGKRYVFHCALGARSALATKTVQDMGLDRVAHIEGGLKAWKEAGGPIEAVAPAKEKAS
jgi:rhodanese-related sulfurtransferase